MLSASTFAALVLGLASLAAAAPAAAGGSKLGANSGVVVTHRAADVFPHALGDVSPWDLAVRFTGYNASMESWLTGLDPKRGATDDERARILLAASYARPYDDADADMAADKEALLRAVGGEAPRDLVARMERR